MRGLSILLALLLTHTLLAQNANFQDAIESIITQKDESANYADMVANLTDIYKHPISINKASKDELEQLFFLTDEQIENILFSHYMTGDFTTPYQLQRVEGLDSLTIRQLIPFVNFDASEKKVDYRITSQVVGRCTYLFETPKGYLPKNDSTPATYLGDKLHALLRGNVLDNKRNEVGWVLEKDPGEPYLTKNGMVPDYYSAYYQTKNRGLLKNLIVGDYNLSFGQGLVLGQGLMVGKSAEVLKIKSTNRGIHKHSSSAENGFFRGVAATVGTSHFSSTSFASFRSIDARTMSDSLSNIDEISTIYTTGLHRTPSEIEAKDAIRETLFGTSIKTTFSQFAIEAGVVQSRFNQPFEPTSQLYQFYNRTEQSATNGFINSNGFYSIYHLFGEVASSSNGTMAFTGGCTIKASSSANFALQIRSIEKGYNAPRLRTFAESSTPSGETGVYLGCQLQPWKRAILATYIDVFQFKWLHYQVNAPSKGYEWMVQLRQQLASSLELELRLKESNKESNYLPESTRIPTLSPQTYRAMRATLSYSSSECFEMSSRLEFSYAKATNESISQGNVICQDFRYTSTNKRISTTARLAFFDTQGYDSRIYLYEPDLLYSYTSLQCMGKGLRGVCNITFRFNRFASLSFRMSRTIFQHITTIGSGNDLISGNHKTEGKIQLIVKI